MNQHEYQQKAIKTEASSHEALARLKGNLKSLSQFGGLDEKDFDYDTLTDISLLGRTMDRIFRALRASKDIDAIKKELFYGKDTTEVGEKIAKEKSNLDLKAGLIMNNTSIISLLALNRGLDNIEHYLDEHDMRALHAVLGIITEAGEILEVLVDIIGTNLARVQNNVNSINNGTSYIESNDEALNFDADSKFEDEMGDLEWYMALLYESRSIDREDVLEMNIDKLKERYKGKEFDQDLSMKKLDEQQKESTDEEE